MFEMRKGTRAVGYIRVSTEEQAEEGYSLDAQERRIRDFCKAKELRLIRVYRDEGLSAFSGETRPGYDSMIAAADEWDVIVALKMDRLWRNQRKFLELIETLDATDKDFISIDESWDTSTPMGGFVRDLFARLAQLESEQTAFRVRAAFAAKFESDESAWFSRAPLGYRQLKDTGGKLIILEDEAAIVRRIFALARAGIPSREIPRILNREGARGKQGAPWSQVQVLQVVHNPVYAGYVHHAGIVRRNGHEAIVDDRTFNAAQIALYVRTRKHHRYPLLVGSDRIKAVRLLTSGKGAAVYVPQERPPGLDRLVASETARLAQHAER